MAENDADRAIATIRRSEQAEREVQERLKRRGGDGTSGGMETRIAVLEAHMEHVREELGKLSQTPAQIATLTERVSHLPTKEYLVKTAAGMLAIIAALITFGEKLQHLVK